MAAVARRAAAAAGARVCGGAAGRRGWPRRRRRRGGAGGRGKAAGGAAPATATDDKTAAGGTGVPAGGAPARATRLAGERPAATASDGRTRIGGSGRQETGGGERGAELLPPPTPRAHPGSPDAAGVVATRHGGGDAREHGPRATPPPGAAVGVWGGRAKAGGGAACRSPLQAPLVPSPGSAGRGGRCRRATDSSTPATGGHRRHRWSALADLGGGRMPAPLAVPARR